MFKRLAKKVLGDPNQKFIGGLKAIVDEIATHEDSLLAMSNEQIREESFRLRDRIQRGEASVDVLPEAFALLREASRRTTGLRHYDVQMMGGILLHQGNVVEMRTGEGKTLVATLPLYISALEGKGVHLITVNDYLARRDGGWMGKIFSFLGMSVGCIGPQDFSGLYDLDYVNPGSALEDDRLVHWRPCTRKEAYECDITYGTSSEFGFDYLRDNMVMSRDRLVQRGLHFAVIDEVDNVLIDESRTPLIISGPSPRTGQEYARFADYVRNLTQNTAGENEEPNGDYIIDHKAHSVTLTDLGVAKIEQRIPEIDQISGDTIYDPSFFHLTYYLDNAMKARYLFHRDQQYMVQNGEVIIIDSFTGRAMPSRRYSDGLHESIEAKEGVEVQRETTTVATITLQNYFRMYTQIAGMTGTAMTDVEEFRLIYGLGVFPLPTNVQYIVDEGKMGLVEKTQDEDGSTRVYYVLPDKGDQNPVFYKRTDHPDQVYKDQSSKDKAIAKEIARIHETGRPVLVGTTSVEHSEQIGTLLNKLGVEHAVLNAKMHQSEALVIAQAGRKNAVTISTNMAGRGTDILLGGNAEGLASGALEDEMFDRAMLQRLAEKWAIDGEPAAREYAKSVSKLDEQLVDELIQRDAEFAEHELNIKESSLAGYVAQQLSAKYGDPIETVSEVIRLQQMGQTLQARQYAIDNNADTAIVEESTHLTNLYASYMGAKLNPEPHAQFISEQVFEENYAARSALIRAVMDDEIAKAYEIADAVPGLTRAWADRVQTIRDETKVARTEVRQLGGLHVIGSERHESRRIDNQLRGRAARQGDSGSSRFFLSLEDDLMLRFGGERMKTLMNRFEIPEDMPIENRMISNMIESAQTRLEGYNFDSRKNLVEYDDVMAKQRETIYRQRRDILLNDDADVDSWIDSAFVTSIDELADNYLDNYQKYIETEVDATLTDHVIESRNTVAPRPVLLRLRSFIPNLRSVDDADIAGKSPEVLKKFFMEKTRENEENGINILQLLQATRQFIPLLPRVPNVGGQLANVRAGRMNAKDQLRAQFIIRLEELYNDFLSKYMDANEKSVLWQRTQQEVNDAFHAFSVEGATVDSLREQQEDFNNRIDESLGNMLHDGLQQMSSDQLVDALTEYIELRKNDWKESIGEEAYKDFQRQLILSSVDREWRDYLTAMDDLRREIGLESYAQRDPKHMYKLRSSEMFQHMRRNIDSNIAKSFFTTIGNVRRQQQPAAPQAVTQMVQAPVRREIPAPLQKAMIDPQKLAQLAQQKLDEAKAERASEQDETKAKTIISTSSGARPSLRIGRNDPCWCGSGKKYKKCHMSIDQQEAEAQ